MTRFKVSFAIGCSCAVLLLVACIGIISRRSETIGGKWETESIRAGLGGDSSFQWLLFRKNPSVLVESDVHNVVYCGDDCVLYVTARRGMAQACIIARRAVIACRFSSCHRILRCVAGPYRCQPFRSPGPLMSRRATGEPLCAGAVQVPAASRPEVPEVPGLLRSKLK